MERIEAGTQVVAEDMHHVREYFSQEGLLPRLMKSLMGSKKRERTRRPKQEKKTDSV
jgi:hypothetical protein